MLGDPGPQLFLERAQPEKEVLGLAHRRRRSGNHRHRVLELQRRVGGAAVLAGVAVLVRGGADGAFAADVAVRQEHAPLFVVGLRDEAAFDVARCLQAPVHLGGEFQVFRGMGRLVVVHADAKALEVPAMPLGHLGDESFGGNARRLGPAAWWACRERRWRRRRCSGAPACVGSAPRCRSGCIPPSAPGAAVRWRRAGRW